MTFRFKSGVVGTFILSDNVPSPYNFESGTGESYTKEQSYVSTIDLHGTGERRFLIRKMGE